LREAASRGALTVGIANNPNTPILDESDHPVRLDTGAEPIAGSTRMKAGTAQRIALNLLSSLLMIRLGRVYEGLMVDVQATNAKLAKRSENMLTHLTGRSAGEVREALSHAEGSVKLAVLLLQGCRPEEGRRSAPGHQFDPHPLPCRLPGSTLQPEPCRLLRSADQFLGGVTS